MFGFVFKSSLYYMLWNKFKKQIIGLGVSSILLFVVFTIYDDLYIFFTDTSKEDLYLLLLAKWVIVIGVVLFNWFNFKKIKNQDNVIEIVDEKPQHHKDILSKPKLLTKSDLILQKYSDKKDD
jgi:hydrogenase-4 membrane subunit HyfE